MNHRLNFKSEPWGDGAELGDAQELYDEDEAELFDTELYEEVLDERGRLQFVRRQPVRPGRPVARSTRPRRPTQFRQPPRPRRPISPARPAIRRRILPVAFRPALIEPVIDIDDSPV